MLYGRDGAPTTNKLMRMWFSAAQRAAGLEETGSLHILRHTFCSRLAIAGVPARTIQELAGHADITTRQRYTHVSPCERKRGIEMREALQGHNRGTTSSDVRK